MGGLRYNLAAAGCFTPREAWCICSSLLAPPSLFLAGRCGGGSTRALWGRSLCIGEGGWIWTEGVSSSGCQMLPSMMREIGREVVSLVLLVLPLVPPMMEIGFERGRVFAKISSTEKLEKKKLYSMQAHSASYINQLLPHTNTSQGLTSSGSPTHKRVGEHD